MFLEMTQPPLEVKLDPVSRRQVQHLPPSCHSNLLQFHHLCPSRRMDRCLHLWQEKALSNYHLPFISSHTLLVKARPTLMPRLTGHHLPHLFPTPYTCSPYDYSVIAETQPEKGHLFFCGKCQVSGLLHLGSFWPLFCSGLSILPWNIGLRHVTL